MTSDDYRITFQLEGFAADDGHLKLPVLLEQFQTLASALASADSIASGGERANQFRVVDLSHSSPATMVVDFVPVRPERDTRLRLLNNLKNVPDVLERDEESAEPNRPFLEALKRLAEPAGRKFASGRIVVGGVAIELTQQLAGKIGAILAPEETEEGAIEGKLEAINLHDNKNEFRLYPVIGPKKIVCRFPAELRPIAVGAVDRYVEVRGALRYRARAPYAHAIDVREIEVLPPEADLPNFSDLRGMAPDATGGKPSEAFIREIRIGWR